MISIGLSGNIGSGKSSVAKVFASFGFVVYDADLLAKRLYKFENIEAEIEKILEITIRKKDGNIDYKSIAKKYFNDESIYHRVNSILYPALKELIRMMISESNQDILVEAAMLYEIGLQDLFDYRINVSAPAEIRHRRLNESRNMSREQIEEREKMQGSERIKEKRSDFIIHNNEEQFVIVQVEEILKKIGHLSSK
ncbi:MAG: dephospho-CoA kinase [Marinilabiliales bacterium]|nr:MAG: dephospho-CoA kinase [Marinilabiliales bacterium]